MYEQHVCKRCPKTHNLLWIIHQKSQWHSSSKQRVAVWYTIFNNLEQMHHRTANYPTILTIKNQSKSQNKTHSIYSVLPESYNLHDHLEENHPCAHALPLETFLKQYSPNQLPNKVTPNKEQIHSHSNKLPLLPGERKHGKILYKTFLCICTHVENSMHIFSMNRAMLLYFLQFKNTTMLLKSAVSTANTNDSDNESVKSKSSNKESGDLKIVLMWGM